MCPRSVTGTRAGCGRQKEAAANKHTGLPSQSVEHFHKQLIPFSDDPHVRGVRLTEVKQLLPGFSSSALPTTQSLSTAVCFHSMQIEDKMKFLFTLITDLQGMTVL